MLKSKMAYLAAGLFFILTGCHAPRDWGTYNDSQLAGPIAVPPGEGVVTIGFSVGKEGYVGQIEGYLVKIDPVSGAHIPAEPTRFFLSNSSYGHNVASGGGPGYVTFHLPAGTYALGAISSGDGDHNRLFMVSHFPGEERVQTPTGYIGHSLARAGQAQSTTPVFTVTEGGAVYIAKIFTVELTGYNERQLPTPLGGSDPVWSPRIP